MTGIFKRVHWRTLRLLGLKRLSWNDQFEAGVWRPSPRSPNTLSRVQQLCAGGKLIEFGCGEGDLPHLLPRDSFSEYTGFDISDVAVERATRRAAASGITACHFQQVDMAEWPGSHSVSLILAEECLYYLSPVQAELFLSTCSSSLASVGSILVIVHSARKHATTLEVCRQVCGVREETLIGPRTFLTLGPRNA